MEWPGPYSVYMLVKHVFDYFVPATQRRRPLHRARFFFTERRINLKGDTRSTYACRTGVFNSPSMLCLGVFGRPTSHTRHQYFFTKAGLFGNNEITHYGVRYF